MSKSSTLLLFAVILGLCFRSFLRGNVNSGSTARQADQGLKDERFEVKCSLVSKGKAGFTRNWLHL